MATKNLQPDGDDEGQEVNSYDEHNEMKNESWLNRVLRAYMRIPLLRKIDPVKLCVFLLIMLIETTLLRLFMPPGWPIPVVTCTCEDQYSDTTLEAMAKAGNQDVKRYLAQKDNPINCAGRRKELLDKLEKAKHKSQPKR
ncbi:MAG: hypothetical protein ABIN91_07745 [Mucilaginibacter sp.]|uniref:hypothetical protein n=1 Tax=Mucilaginibacter sp. TaxID=1882438 RepID=UPI003267453D